MIKPKNRICISCGRNDQPHFSKKRCKGCAQKDYSKGQPKKIMVKINKLSDKRKVQQAEYLKKRLVFLNENQTCQIKLKGCTFYATEVHHSAGRTGTRLIDETEFKATCRSCHTIVELNPGMAKQNGYSKHRL